MAKKKTKYSDKPVAFDKEKLFNICKTDLLKMICEAVSLVAHGNDGVDAFFLKGDKNALLSSQSITRIINKALEESKKAQQYSFPQKSLSNIFFVNEKTAQQIYYNFSYSKKITESYHQGSFALFLEQIKGKYPDNFGTEIEKALKSIGKSGSINFVAHSYTKTCSFQNVNRYKTIVIEAKIDWESYTVIISGEDKKYTISLLDVPKFWAEMAKITPDDEESKEVVKDSRQTALFTIADKFGDSTQIISDEKIEVATAKNIIQFPEEKGFENGVKTLNKVIEIDKDAFEPFDKGNYKEFQDQIKTQKIEKTKEITMEQQPAQEENVKKTAKISIAEHIKKLKRILKLDSTDNKIIEIIKKLERINKLK